MSLSPEQVRKVAKLARLELADADLGPMAEQLNRILGYVDQLQQVNTDGVEPMAHPFAGPERLPRRRAAAVAAGRRGAQERPGPDRGLLGVPAVFDPADEMSA
jgi:aspartyl-tRNA(Asn)/glutamyl-tRNA(Gln) amidotransferase subunit C